MEIGGYFGLEHFDAEDYYPQLKKLNTARNALWYLIKARNIQKLYIPYYLCDAVSDLCDRVGCAYEYYAVDAHFLPMLDAVPEDAYVYIVNYFGQLDDGQVYGYQKRYGQIILDNVQAFFREPLPGIDTIYSCRKFFGVPDGAYLATDAQLRESLPVDISRDRMTHVLGRYEQSASAYYEAFKSNDESFYGMELRRMSALTENLLRAIHYDVVKERRNSNYRTLEKLLGRQNTLQLKMPEGPYCYPFYCENGGNVRGALAKHKIYVPTLWPNVLDMDDPVACDYAANILPLPCDQRYTEADMQVLAEALLNELKV